MAKKYKTTQELANGFPDWTKLRQDEQSVGQGLLNVISRPFERMETELYRGAKNLALTTANIGEIDLIYRFQLPETFAFEVDNPSQLQPISLTPTVSGRIDNNWYEITEAETGTVREFWYEATPSRISIAGVYSGVNHWIIDSNSEQYTFYPSNNELFLPNRLYVDVQGTALLQENAEAEEGFLQAKIRITGTTWKDTIEAEQINYIYSREQQSLKAWKEINTIEAIDFPASGNIRVRSHGFNLDSYEDTFENLSQYAHSRDNLTTFWGIVDSCYQDGVKLLEVSTYAATRALDVLGNRVDKLPIREWELVDSGNQTILPVDLAPIPYEQRAWVASASGLFLYDLEFDQPSQKELMGRTTSPLAQIVTSRDYVTREEEVEVELRFVRPIKTVIRHRLTIKYPDGTSMGVLEDGTLVPTSTDYWVRNLRESRLLRPAIDFVLDDYGDHVFTLEAEYAGGKVEIDKRIVRVASKQPLAEFPLYNRIGTTISGVDIDHQQRLLVADSLGNVHEITPHYDTMLIDFNTKEIVFREPYDEIKVIK